MHSSCLKPSLSLRASPKALVKGDLIVPTQALGSLQIWRGAGNACSQVASFHGHSDSVMCLSWNSDGTVLATGKLSS